MSSLLGGEKKGQLESPQFPEPPRPRQSFAYTTPGDRSQELGQDSQHPRLLLGLQELYGRSADVHVAISQVHGKLLSFKMGTARRETWLNKKTLQRFRSGSKSISKPTCNGRVV